MVKILSYNIQHGIDHLKRLQTKEVIINLDKVAEIIKKYDADIVGLNEVYDAPVENLEKQAKYIAEKIGYYYYFGKAINIKGGEYGNALLSKYPILSAENIEIPDPIEKKEKVFYESRRIIKSVIKIEEIEYNVIVSHFGLANDEQTNATDLLLEIVEGMENIIFMGDLNMIREKENIKRIEKVLINTLVDDSLSFPSDNPVEKIDYIFVSKDIKINRAKILDEIFSDHLPHLAIIN